MLRSSKPELKPQVLQEEVRELSQISIESNVGKTRLHEDPSTHYESVLPAYPTQDYTKKSKHYSGDESASDRFQLRQRVPKRVSSSKDKEREKSKNKRTSPNCFKPNEPTPKILGVDRCEQMMEKMRDLESSTEKRQQRFANAVEEIRKDLQVKEQRSQNLRKDLDQVKKELAERKKDINVLIQMVKELAVGHLSDTNMKVITRYPSQQSSQTVKSDRDKPKKTSNEKPSKKVSSPGKKPGPQLKQRSPTGRLIGKN